MKGDQVIENNGPNQNCREDPGIGEVEEKTRDKKHGVSESQRRNEIHAEQYR